MNFINLLGAFGEITNKCKFKKVEPRSQSRKRNLVSLKKWKSIAWN